MTDKENEDFVVQSLIEEFDLKDGQVVDGRQIAEIIARGQQLFEEKSASETE